MIQPAHRAQFQRLVMLSLALWGLSACGPDAAIGGPRDAGVRSAADAGDTGEPGRDAGDVSPVPDAGVSPAPDAGASAPDASMPSACDYYVDPAVGAIGNPGTAEAPWLSLQTVFSSRQPLTPGDRVCLAGGDHGAPSIEGLTFASTVTFAALPGQTPTVSRIAIVDSSNLEFDGLLVDGSSTVDVSADEKESFFVVSDVLSHHLTFRNCTIQSAASSETWTRSDWYMRTRGGMDMRGPYISLLDSTVRNTYHAVSLRGDHSVVRNVLIDNFAGDGIRGHGSFSLYEFNVVRDAYIEDYAIQHDDAFQAFNLESDPLIEGVVVRNNSFLQFADPITRFVLDNELMSQTMQGIILTDGYADGWLVENNLVVNNSPHGISIYGGRHCVIQNNTVVQPPHWTDTELPWIRITDAKTGQPNFDNVIQDNLSARYVTWEFDSTSSVDRNTVFLMSNLDSFFANAAEQDYHLFAESLARDTGLDAAPGGEDLDGRPRVAGGRVDSGAYEFQ